MNAKYKKERKREILLRNLPYNADCLTKLYVDSTEMALINP